MVSGKEHSESEVYYPEELQFQENSEFTPMTFVAGGVKGKSQTGLCKPYNKVLINLKVQS